MCGLPSENCAVRTVARCACQSRRVADHVLDEYNAPGRFPSDLCLVCLEDQTRLDRGFLVEGQSNANCVATLSVKPARFEERCPGGSKRLTSHDFNSRMV